VQGMAYIAAILLLNLNAPKTFEVFSNLVLPSPLLSAFYTFDLPEIQSYYRVFEYYMAKKVPRVLRKFEELGITPDMYLLEWVYTLFSRCFNMEIVW
jgi:hypothetical protein